MSENRRNRDGTPNDRKIRRRRVTARRSGRHSPSLSHPLPRSGPSPYLAIREAGSAIELARLFARLPVLARCPRGHGERVLVFPGFAAGDGSTLILRSTLRYLGYRVNGWGLGLNTGNVRRLLPEVVRLVARSAKADAAPIRLVGWSLGGVLAREVAREIPHHIDRLITLGSPVIGGPKYTATARFYRTIGLDLDKIEQEIEARESTPLEIPITAIYTETDGVVDWRACIDHKSPRVEHVCVRSTHFGLGFAPEVLRIVAERLAVHDARGSNRHESETPRIRTQSANASPKIHPQSQAAWKAAPK